MRGPVLQVDTAGSAVMSGNTNLTLSCSPRSLQRGAQAQAEAACSRQPGEIAVHQRAELVAEIIAEDGSTFEKVECVFIRSQRT